jgi:phospholipid transport system substrate-binding protein
MKSILKLIVNTLFIMMISISISHAAVGPDLLVKQTAEDVLQALKSDKDLQAGDQQKIYALAEEKILPNFDFDRVCRMVLGKNWRSATDVQKEAFKKEFRSLLMRTYASALSKFRNQAIEYKPAQLSKDKTLARVKTEILQDSGPSIAVDYTLQVKNDIWKVFDITIENVSLVTNYRSQFSGEIRNNGLDSLIAKLADKNKKAGVK